MGPKKVSKKNVIEDSDSDNDENVAPPTKFKTAYSKPSSSSGTKISTSDFFGGLKTKKAKGKTVPRDVTDTTKIITPKKKRSLESASEIQPKKKQKVVDLTGPSTKSTKHDSDEDFIIDDEVDEELVEKKKKKKKDKKQDKLKSTPKPS